MSASSHSFRLAATSLPIALLAAVMILPAGAADAPATLHVPLSAGTGAPKETKAVYDSTDVKLMVITLRQGTVLPEHAAPVPVLIQALAGSGTLTTPAATYNLKPGAIQPLPAGLVHAVTPDKGTDMVLLVTYLKNGRPAADDHHHHH